MQTVPEVPK